MGGWAGRLLVCNVAAGWQLHPPACRHLSARCQAAAALQGGPPHQPRPHRQPAAAARRTRIRQARHVAGGSSSRGLSGRPAPPQACGLPTSSGDCGSSCASADLREVNVTMKGQHGVIRRCITPATHTGEREREGGREAGVSARCLQVSPAGRAIGARHSPSAGAERGQPPLPLLRIRGCVSSTRGREGGTGRTVGGRWPVVGAACRASAAAATAAGHRRCGRASAADFGASGTYTNPSWGAGRLQGSERRAVDWWRQQGAPAMRAD